MEDGRIAGFGSASSDEVLSRWARLAAEARAAAARAGVGPPGGTARERTRLVRALSRGSFRAGACDDAQMGINEAAGAHLLAEVPTYTGGSWRRATLRHRPALARQLSSPPPSVYNKRRRDVRRTVSADESTLQRKASALRRWIRPRNRTLSRWTPRTIRRLIISNSDTPVEDNQTNDATDDSTADTMTPFNSLTSNGIETTVGTATHKNLDSNQETEEEISEMKIWWEYALACGWWGLAYWVTAVVAQTFAVAADCWLTYTTAENGKTTVSADQMWSRVMVYAAWCTLGLVSAGAAQAWCACAGARARRTLHERALHATLHAPLHYHNRAPLGDTLHRFCADIQVIDKKLTTAIGRWAQLALLCVAATLVNVVAAPWSVLALLPAFIAYLMLQSLYLCNARELQRAEANSAAGVVSLCAETCAGGGTVRVARLQPRMRAAFMRRLDHNHNALLLLNAANRWLGLSLDLVGAASVCVTLGVALSSGGGGSIAGLAGAYSLLLPAYLAHLAKCRADLDAHLAALERLHQHTNVPQEDYREDCPIPSGWQRNGKIEFENVTINHEPGSQPILNNINFTIEPGEKVAICGRSGSGKSTLVLSCAGATCVTNGRVLIDGQDVTRVPLRTLRHRVVVLPQEPVMFSGTLRENLDPLAVHTDEEIWLSLRAVGLYDFVTAQPAGLECSLSLSRGGWSVGRIGRACAARAGLRARLASVLVLDEPAAALDAPAERALLHAIAALAPNTTVITVAHRVSSVRGYDRAVVLEGGVVAELGTVRALLAQPTARLAAMLAAANTMHAHT